MYIIVANQNIRMWLENNLKKHEQMSTNKTIKAKYVHASFEILLYTSNTLTITGQIKDKIYNKLILISQEENYLGSDEVGVGDFFGPTVYTTVYLDFKSLTKLSSSYVNIKDSKKFKDDEIIEVYNKIKEFINYEVEIVYDKDINSLNSIAQKTYYHNLNITKFQNNEVKKCVIDLFTTENAFYKYTNELSLSWNNELILETKADSKFICVALASIISRAIFLEQIDLLEKKYKMKIPKGSVNISASIDEFLRKYSKEELAKICKTTFKTFKEL